MVCDFVDLRSRIFHSMGVMSTKNCELDFCQLVIAHERSATVGHAKQHTKSMVQYFSNSVTNNKQQASKIWPLARGFLPYKRESKDYKSYNINKSSIEKYL